jgi:hypothetical protein
MPADVSQARQHLLEAILSRQDESFRWGYDPAQARHRPEYLYYSPTYRASLWTLVLLADLQAPPGLAPVEAALRLVSDRFYSPEHGLFRLPDMCRFPIPCLNGNLIHLHQVFGAGSAERVDSTIAFFAAHQRFDDGDYRTPGDYPYCGNRYCYGRHTCYWGVVKLLKGLSFVPKDRRSADARRLLQACLDFILQHEVCFSSRHPERLLNPDIAKLTFPNGYKSDFLEILWLLAREGVREARLGRALDLLRSKRQPDGTWLLEKHQNTVVSVGQPGRPNALITARANEVLAFYGG